MRFTSTGAPIDMVPMGDYQEYFQWDFSKDRTDNLSDICEEVFEDWNYHGCANIAAAMTKVRFRSMSVGDAMFIKLPEEELWVLCETIGWGIFSPESFAEEGHAVLDIPMTLIMRDRA